MLRVHSKFLLESNFIQNAVRWPSCRGRVISVWNRLDGELRFNKPPLQGQFLDGYCKIVPGGDTRVGPVKDPSPA